MALPTTSSRGWETLLALGRCGGGDSLAWGNAVQFSDRCDGICPCYRSHDIRTKEMAWEPPAQVLSMFAVARAST